MSKYKDACSSLRPGQLDRLIGTIKDSKPIIQEEIRTMLSRKHYKAIAEIVKSHTDVHDHPDLNCWEAIDTEPFIANLADYFAQDNPQFDRSRFLEACGL